MMTGITADMTQTVNEITFVTVAQQTQCRLQKETLFRNILLDITSCVPVSNSFYQLDILNCMFHCKTGQIQQAHKTPPYLTRTFWKYFHIIHCTAVASSCRHDRQAFLFSGALSIRWVNLTHIMLESAVEGSL